MAYEEDPDDGEYDDFEMSQDSEDERNRAFYGDDYTLLSETEKQSQQAAMSMTMQQREIAEK
jgi:hypothetical protein